MGTFPQIRPVQLPDYQGIRRDKQVIALGDEQLHQEKLQTQAAEQQQKEVQLAQEVIGANGGDIEKALPQLAGKVSPGTYQKIADAHLAHQEKVSKLKNDEFARQQQQIGQVLTVIDEASKLPPEQYQAAWPQIAARLKSVDPEIGVDPSQPIPIEQLPMVQRGVQSQDAYLKREGERRAAATQEETARHNAAIESKLPAAEQEFQAFYAPWLDAKGLPKNAKHELQARREFKQLGRSVVGGGGSGSEGLTDDAIEQAAQRYVQSGELPAFGMGKAGAAARVKILNRAAQIGKGESIAENKAGYRADSESLRKTQGMLDAVNAYEQTASKNLDLFLDAAKRIPDTGVPWMNKPIREVSGEGMGSVEMAAFKTARQVALTEIARVVNNPSLTGVLSDSARHEIAELNPDNATYAQIVRVAKTLKKDMANRHESLANQVKEIKGRMKPAGGGKFVVTAPDGSQHPFDTQAQADEFKKLAGIKN